MKYVVVPFSKPDCVTNVTENWRRQRAEDWRIVIVRNGAARDAPVVPTAPNTEVRVIWDAGAAQARNAGILWALSEGATHIACWDCDDYYGPGYLTELEWALSGHPLVGKKRHFVEYRDFLVKYEHCWTTNPAQWALGCTHAFRAEVVQGDPEPYPVGPKHEDAAFIDKQLAKGWKLHATTPYNFVYNQTREDHANHVHPIGVELKIYGRDGYSLYPRDRTIADSPYRAEHERLRIHPQ